MTQIKSKQRVADHGEVFTAEREVLTMLDLVKHETARIDSRFLEPACGDGNFLVEILRRKLVVVKRLHATDFEHYALLAVSTLYGIDILQDNVHKCRERLLQQFDGCSHLYHNTIKHIINLNIVWGDTLALRTPDKKQAPIILPEWQLLQNGMIKRRDYVLSTLFASLHQTELSITAALVEYPPVHYLNLGRNCADT